MKLKRIGFFLGPLLFFVFRILPGPEVISADAWKVLALGVLMLVWWISEAVPIPVTALLPMILLPILGIYDLKTAAAPYANPIVYLFMGGFMLALAMEKWNLHRRIALNIVKITGTNANGIILGFMVATGFMSMWISNTATSIMMLPIALSVIDLLTSQTSGTPSKGIRYFSLSIMLGIAYAANIGGTATIIGTPPNVVFAAFMLETYQIEVTFAKWIILGLPFAVLLITITYFIIVKVIYPNGLGDFKEAGPLIDRQIKELGKMSVGEKRTLIIFLATAFSWVFRSKLNNWIGWLELSDTSIALLSTMALFLIPVNFKANQFVLEWKATEKLPWGILLLFGGGLSLAGALYEVGLVDYVGSFFEGKDSFGFIIAIGLTAVSLFLTEVISNVALVTIFLPVVGGIAIGLGISPLLICIPVTLAASCAFMLPMSTPPNAIVFASGHLTVTQMAKAGFLINILAILLIALFNETLVFWLFQANG